MKDETFVKSIYPNAFIQIWQDDITPRLLAQVLIGKGTHPIGACAYHDDALVWFYAAEDIKSDMLRKLEQ